MAFVCAACGGGGGGDATGASANASVAAPSITTQPRDQSVTAGAAATFSVSATGTAALTYQWRRNGVDVAGATASSYALAATMAGDSASQWTVAVHNGAGTTLSAAALLTVTPVTTVKGVSLLAGSPRFDNRTATTEAWIENSGMAMDPAGNLYLVNYNRNTVMKMTPDGVLHTLAGTIGTSGTADGNGAAARFFFLQAITVNAAGEVYVLDNGLVRRISPLGDVTTLPLRWADTGNLVTWLPGGAMVIDAADNIYLASSTEILQISSSWMVSLVAGAPNISGQVDGTGSAARFTNLQGLALDRTGTELYASDYTTNTVRKVSTAGVVTTVAGVYGQLGSTDGAAAAALFNGPAGLAIGDAGELYISDTNNFTIRKLSPNGVVTTLTGKVGVNETLDGSGADATFRYPSLMARDQDGNLYVSAGDIRKVTPAGVVTTFSGSAANTGSTNGVGAAARFNSPISPTVDRTGTVLLVDRDNGLLRRVSPDGKVAAAFISATIGYDFLHPSGAVLDSQGNLFVSSANNHLIWKITPDGVLTQFAGGRYGTDDGQGAAAGFIAPAGLAVDAADNLYVADADLVRKISPTGLVSTLVSSKGGTTCSYLNGPAAVASLCYVAGIAVDPAGYVYISERYGNIIRKIGPDGTVTPVAGTPQVIGAADGVGAAASFNSPLALALDGAGNLYVADSNNSAIRKVTPAGVVTTVVGAAGANGIVLGALPGTLTSPTGLTFDGNGLLYITSGNALLKVKL